MAATARMILQVDPAEKARWTAEARKAGISTSEFVRRRAAAPEPDPELTLTPEEAEQLKLAAAEINAAANRMSRNLDAISANLREMVLDMTDPARIAEQRARARADLEASGARFDFSLLRATAA